MGIDRQQIRWISGKQPLRKSPKFELPSITAGGYVLLVIPCFATYLGIWQLRRRKWKLELIEALESRFNMDPMELPKNLEEMKQYEYCPFKVRGTFDYSQEVYLGPRSGVAERSNSMSNSRVPGLHVITPFKVADRNLTIMVNRGWYSNNQVASEELRIKGQVEGEQEIVGICRLDQKYNPSYMLFGDAEKAQEKYGIRYFVVRKLDLLGRETGAAPIFLDCVTESKNPSAPQLVKPSADLRNTHMEYALTWFTLAIISFWLWAYNFRKPPSSSQLVKFLKNQEIRQQKMANIRSRHDK